MVISIISLCTVILKNIARLNKSNTKRSYTINANNITTTTITTTTTIIIILIINTGKYWVDVQRGMFSFLGETDPL